MTVAKYNMVTDERSSMFPIPQRKGMTDISMVFKCTTDEEFTRFHMAWILASKISDLKEMEDRKTNLVKEIEELEKEKARVEKSRSRSKKKDGGE